MPCFFMLIAEGTATTKQPGCDRLDRFWRAVYRWCIKSAAYPVEEKANFRQRAFAASAPFRSGNRI
jgi:hypothetical protein